MGLSGKVRAEEMKRTCNIIVGTLRETRRTCRNCAPRAHLEEVASRMRGNLKRGGVLDLVGRGLRTQLAVIEQHARLVAAIEHEVHVREMLRKLKSGRVSDIQEGCDRNIPAPECVANLRHTTSPDIPAYALRHP